MAVKLRDLPQEEKGQIMEEITHFFREEHDLELGILGTNRIYEFFQEVLGDRIYNQALDDARRFYESCANNMEADYYALYRDVW